MLYCRGERERAVHKGAGGGGVRRGRAAGAARARAERAEPAAAPALPLAAVLPGLQQRRALLRPRQPPRHRRQ